LSDVSSILALPLIQPSQAQKHVTHNEALRVLDVLVQPVVASRTLTSPPPAAGPGDRHIVAAGGLGAWAGQDGSIALREETGWMFLAPQPGWQVHVTVEAAVATWTGTGWVTQAETPLTVPGLGVSTSPDAVNRLAVASEASLFSHAGAGHQVKVNKAAPGHTASLLFQSAWSGRAEMGLAGSDDFAIRVSADGALFRTGLSVSKDSGVVAVPLGLLAGAGSVAAPAVAFQDDPDTGLYSGAADQIGFAAGGGRRATLSATALTLDVGVRVDVPATGSVTEGMRLRNPAPTAAGSGVALHFQPNGTESRSASIQSVQVVAGNTADLRFLTVNAATPAEHLRVTNTGRVGIGTGTPAQKLDVVGTVMATNFLRGAAQVYAHDNILGAVGQSGGVPTGAIVERGSNANGSFVRFADGTMRCVRGALGAAGASIADGALFRSADVLWTFPAVFIEPPVVAGGADDPEAWVSAAAPTAAACTLRVRSSVSKAAALNLRVVAFGRWV